MHISQWNPIDEWGYQIRALSVADHYMANMLGAFGNVVCYCRDRKTYNKWPWKNHGKECQCRGCSEISGGLWGHTDHCRCGCGWLKDISTIDITKDYVVDISVVSDDDIENEIIIPSQNAKRIQYEYQLTNIHLIKLLKMKSPLRVPNYVIDAKTFFDALKRGQIRS